MVIFVCAGFVVTGSQDNTIIVHSMDEVFTLVI